MVAPLAGAWIEIVAMFNFVYNIVVAPLAGAWIEIKKVLTNVDTSARSRPSRARGLKYGIYYKLGKKYRSRPSRARGLKSINWSTYR